MSTGHAFLAAGVIARVGVRIGLPTMPLFMVAGILLGPNTPGLSLVDDPSEMGVLSVLGLAFLLFYLGLEFSVGVGLRIDPVRRERWCCRSWRPWPWP